MPNVRKFCQGKIILILFCLILNGCALGVAAAITKGSQVAQSATGKDNGKTLTASDYEACEAGDEAACNRCLMYSAMLGPFHCTTFHYIDPLIPTISEVRPQGYGGSNYYAMPENYK